MTLRGVLLRLPKRRDVRRLVRGVSLRTAKAARMPFPRLVQHFLVRLVRGADSTSVDVQVGAGPLLGLLAAPGAFLSLLMLDKYSSLFSWFRGRLHEDLLRTSASDKYMFLSIAMAVTGIITVLKWDRILPDPQDYLNLTPLPIHPRVVLLANTAAIAITAVVLAMAVNGASMVLFPLFVSSAAPPGSIGLLRFVGVHSVCVTLASFFAFCGVFAALGTAFGFLPRALFQAWSAWLRTFLLVGFIVLLLSGFAGPAVLRELALRPDSAVRLLAPLWFLSLYQSLQGRATPGMASLVPLALSSVGASVGMMAVSYGLSYRRRYAGVLEGQSRPSSRFLGRFILALLDSFSNSRTGFERATYRFVVRALLRNEAQRLCISVSLGLGWFFAAQAVALSVSGNSPDSGSLPPPALLAAPLMVAYLLLTGLRLAWEIPAAVPANWVFRSIVDPRAHETAGIARQVMLAFLTVSVLLPSFALTWWWRGLAMATLHTSCVLLLSLCLMEFLLAGYRKIPFTCFMPGFRENLPLVCVLHVLGFVVFAQLGARLEQWILVQPVLLVLVAGVLVAAWLCKRARVRGAVEAGEYEPGISFDGRRGPAIERLRLSDGDDS
jgi:hypothetical protein